MSIIKLFTLFTIFEVLTARVSIIGPTSLVLNMRKIDNGSKDNYNLFIDEDFNDYTEIGSYCVLTDSDATKIANIPIRTCGILNVYSSNGDNINNTQYKYLVQEYTTLTGNYKYIRHITYFCKINHFVVSKRHFLLI